MHTLGASTLKGCPRCTGKVQIDRDHWGWYEQCIQCGYMRDLQLRDVLPLLDCTVYSKRRNVCTLSTPPLEAYASIVGEERIETLQRVALSLEGLKLVEVNATAQGGGVAEMLHSSIPFLNALGIEAEWKVIRGDRDFFECTKSLHNQLQGMKGSFTPEMQQIYFSNLEHYAEANLIDNDPDVVVIHDPQPLALARCLRKSGGIWMWRCHIDIQEAALRANSGLWDFITDCTGHYDAAIFSAPQYAGAFRPLVSFIIPPFIDPLSAKNREMSEGEIGEVLAKYNIDAKVPIIAQIGRFDRWKGIDRTIATYRQVRKERRCQLILAGGLAADDPEGERILVRVYEDTKNDDDIHVLNLSLSNRLENWMEVNALQRAASVIMQPSAREGFGLTITEALWKGKPVIAADVGGIPMQIREDDTGYFYKTPHKTAQKVNYLLDNPQVAETVGARGRRYVKEYFLMPDRITDYLIAIDVAMKATRNKGIPTSSIMSFHFPIEAKQTKMGSAAGMANASSNQGQYPRKYAEREQYLSVPGRTEEAVNACKQPRVIIVDDEQVVRDLLSHDLGDYGYLCTTACGGDDALTKLATEDFEVMLLDLKLPGMSGMEVLEWINSQQLGTAVIMITVVDDSETVTQAMKLGASAYIVKPFDLDRVNTSINTVLKYQETVRRDIRSEGSTL